MADVPAWVLVANSVLVGGFGLASSFLVPRAQREARAADQRNQADAIMRQKAEEIFAEIVKARESGNTSMMAISRVISGRDEDEGVYDMVAFRALDRVKSLLATYYPQALPIIEQGREALRAKSDPIHAALMAVPDGPQSANGLGLRAQMTNAVTISNSEIADRLEKFMVCAVAKYVPARPAG